MTSYTDTMKKAVQGVIDKYTADTLDNFVRATIKDAGMKKMDEGASAIEVADAVFDCMSADFSGNAYMAAACQQICPRSILLLIRHEIVKTLK